MESQSFLHKRYVQVLLTLILLALLAALVAYTQRTFKEAQGTFTGETTISVSGEGKVLALPDIGQFSFAVRGEGEDAVTAQESSAVAINAIIAYLTDAGVAEKDIKTQNYNLSPKYRYEERVCISGGYCPPGEPILDGYEVYQNVQVKVRDLDAAGTLISGVGEKGATDISSLQFTIDDESGLKAQARAAAIADAKAKAEVLAADLGMKINKIVGFYENGDAPYPMMERATMAMEDGLGGDAMKTAPSIPVGENEIGSSVSITYQLR